MPYWQIVDKSLGALPPGTVTQTEQQVRDQSPQLLAGQTVALERDGNDAVVPFAPGTPLFPAIINPQTRDGGSDPRRYEFPVAWNLQVTEQRAVPFSVLRQVADQCDLVRRCIEVVKSQVTGLEWDISLAPSAIERVMGESGGTGHAAAAKEARDALLPDISRAVDFWKMPDPVNGLTFADWIACLLEEMIVLDAATIYPSRTYGGDIQGLLILDGSTIRPLLDQYGNRPTPPHPAYQQVLYGFPRGEFHAIPNVDADFQADDLIYAPRSRRVMSPYGYSAVERALPLADLYMKRQQWIRQEFTEGATPETFVVTDAQFGNNPELLRSYEAILNDRLSGNMDVRKRMHLLPAGMQPIQMSGWDSKFKTELDELLVKDLCAHFGVLPSQIGHTPRSGLGGKGHQEGEQISADSLGIKPTLSWLSDLLNSISYRFLGMSKDLAFVFNDGSTRDETAQANRRQVELFSGQATLNELRAEQGRPLYTFPEADQPLIVAGSTVSPIATVSEATVSDIAATDAQGNANGSPAPVAGQDTPDMDVTPQMAQNAPMVGCDCCPDCGPNCDGTCCDKCQSNSKAADAELAAFARFARKRDNLTRPFQFQHQPAEYADLLNDLGRISGKGAADAAIMLKAGGRRGRDSAPVLAGEKQGSRTAERVHTPNPRFTWHAPVTATG